MSDKSLFSITRQTQELVEHLVENGGELTEEMESALTVNEKQLATKVDGYAHFLDRLDLEQDFFKRRAEMYLQVAKSLANMKKQLQGNLKYCLVSLQEQEVVGNEFRFKLSKARPKISIESEDKIPKDYFKEEVVSRLDKEMLRASLERGVPIEGVSLEKNYSLRKYLNKGKK